jgi:hypothetical protein
MSLVGEPRTIFLDEPSTGLDPRSRRTMWQIIRDLVGGGVTIFQVPGEAGARALRRLLDRLDSAGVEPDELSVHTPDLLPGVLGGLPGVLGGHGRLELAQVPEPLGQRDQPDPGPPGVFLAGALGGPRS